MSETQHTAPTQRQSANSGFLSRLVRKFIERKCSHEFELKDLHKTGESEDGCRRVAWPCRKCGKVFYAHCGLDISPKHGFVFPDSATKINEAREAGKEAK